MRHDEQRHKEPERDEIDENLRKVYSRLLDEKVPDKFTQLLDELRRKGAQK